MLTIGSLCTGIGGLDLAVERHFGAELLWYSDIDPKANEVMAVRRPDAIAIGDLTAVDPSTIEVPDILTAGWPCQPVSVAGRLGGTKDPRWLFDEIAAFINGLKSPPTWMVFENVRRLLSDDDGRTALGVVRQVAAMGFDLRWGCVRASDAGLPHRRERFFSVATHPDGLGAGRGRPRQVPGPSSTGEGEGPERQRLRDAAGHGRPTPADPDHHGGAWGPEHRRPARGQHEGQAGPYEPETPRGREASPDSSRWGDYATAIRRWELTFGIEAPPALGDSGTLDQRFVEWMCGFEPGWVTDVIPSRRQALRLLGNSVCPPQAELALALLA